MPSLASSFPGIGVRARAGFTGGTVSHPKSPRALLNIGGMANVTWVPRRGATDGVLAFDTGPGIAVLDAVVRLRQERSRAAVPMTSGRGKK